MLANIDKLMLCSEVVFDAAIQRIEPLVEFGGGSNPMFSFGVCHLIDGQPRQFAWQSCWFLSVCLGALLDALAVGEFVLTFAAR